MGPKMLTYCYHAIRFTGTKVLNQTNYQTCLSEMGRFPNCPNGRRYSKPQTRPLFSRKKVLLNSTTLDFSRLITFFFG